MTEIKLARVRARLEHPLQCPLVSHQACAGHRFDRWVDLQALFEGVQCREREADFGLQRAHDQLLAAGRPHRCHEVGILPGGDARAIVGGHAGQYLAELRNGVAVDAGPVIDSGQHDREAEEAPDLGQGHRVRHVGFRILRIELIWAFS